MSLSVTAAAATAVYLQHEGRAREAESDTGSAGVIRKENKMEKKKCVAGGVPPASCRIGRDHVTTSLTGVSLRDRRLSAPHGWRAAERAGDEKLIE